MKNIFFVCILSSFWFGVSADAQTSKIFMDLEKKQITITASEEIVSIEVEGKEAQQFVWDKDQAQHRRLDSRKRRNTPLAGCRSNKS